MQKQKLGRLFLCSFLSKKGELDLSGENNNLPEQNQGGKETPKEIPQIDEDEINNIIDKRLARGEDKLVNEIVQSYLSKLGLNEDDVKRVSADIKEKRKTQPSKNEEVETLKTQLANLETSFKEKELALSKKELDISIKENLKTFEIKSKAKALLQIDESKAIKQDGSIDEDYVKTTMEQFKKDFPEFVEVKEKLKPGVKLTMGIPKNNTNNGQGQNVDISKLTDTQKWKLFYEMKK